MANREIVHHDHEAASRRVLEHIGMRYEEDLSFAGLRAAKYIIVRNEFVADDSVYRLA